MTVAAHGTAVRSARLDDDVVRIELADGTPLARHVLALRDGCPCLECRHPVSGQRLFESARVLRRVRAAEVCAEADGSLAVEWDDGHRSVFPASSFGEEPSRAIRLWDSSLADDGLTAYRWANIAQSGEARRAWLEHAAVLGFSLLRGVPVEPGYVERVAALFGAVRETNYGRVFDVSVTVGAANLADTALPLSPHTDNPYREPAPTLQLLHCLASEVDGGETLLVDGYAAVERLRRTAPEKLATLAREPIRYAYRDDHADLSARVPVVSLDAAGAVVALYLNNRSKGIPDGDPERVASWYDAYLSLVALVESPEQQVVFRLEPGDVVLFDNLRVLHGRTGFASTGSRRLQGCYADRDGLLSTLALLER